MGKATCSVEGCTNQVHCRALCSMHYQRWKKDGDPGPAGTVKVRKTCTIEGCEEYVHGHGLCPTHRWRKDRYGDPTADLRDYPDECTIDGCPQPFYGNGLCEMHYARLRRRGDVGRAERESMERGVQFEWLLRELESPRDECMEWPFVRLPNRYGQVSYDGRWRYVHHVAMILSGMGDRPEGMQACHACDNPPCFNPRHLRWDTPQENYRDRFRLKFCR